MANRKEKRIISALRNNSRLSLADLSRETMIPITTIYDSVVRLRMKGILERYITILDYPAIGFNIRVFLALKSSKKKELLDFLACHPNINSLSKTYGSYDFIADAVFMDIKGYETFKEQTNKLAKIEEHYIIDCLKAEKAKVS